VGWNQGPFLLADIRDSTGVSYVLIRHDLAVVRQLAEHAIVLWRGRVAEQGPASTKVPASASSITFPASVMRPAETGVSPATALSSVDFPAPFGPSTPRT
jgi:ABC-type dipeptide/oligopeptide/nickel transport system ATPase component